MPITIHRTKCSRSRPIARPSKPLDRWDTLFAIIDRSTAVLCIHALKKPLGCAGDEGELRPALPQDRRQRLDRGRVCVVRAAW